MDPTPAEVFFQLHGKLAKNPALIKETLAVLRDPACAAGNLVAILEQEPGVSSRVLKAANSVFFGAPKSITSLKAAVVRMGNQNVARFALSSALGSSGGGPWVDFWKHSTAVALLSRHMGVFLKSFSRQEEEELFTMGLLHDLGLMLELGSGRFGEVLARLEGGRNTLEQAERAAFGFDHTELGGVAAGEWNFPEDLVAAITCHHSPDASPAFQRKATLIHLANLIAHGFRFPSIQGAAAPDTSESYLQALDLPVEQLVLFGDWLLSKKDEIDASGKVMGS